MNAPLTPERNGLRRAINRATVRMVLVASVLVAGSVAVRGLEAALHATFSKPPAEPRRSFSQIPTNLGHPVRYMATGSDEVLDPETVETLGTEHYLVRCYQDKSVTAGAPGSAVNLNVNYYPTGTSTPHVPEVCWAGSGRVEAANSRVTFVVKGIKRRDGSEMDLPMRMISFVPVDGKTVNDAGEPIYSNVAYVFHVNGEYVSGSQEVTSRFWKASNRYAYHAKIEVTPLEVSGVGRGVLTCTQAEAQRIVGDFIREALPEVEECLPDPSNLTEGSVGTDQASSKQR
jgi:hypothetical protein